MKDLTPRQSKVMAAIVGHMLRHTAPPTWRELMAELGIASTTGISDHLTLLAKKGCVTWGERSVKGLRVLPSAPGMRRYVVEVTSESGVVWPASVMDISPTFAARQLEAALYREGLVRPDDRIVSVSVREPSDGERVPDVGAYGAAGDE